MNRNPRFSAVAMALIALSIQPADADDGSTAVKPEEIINQALDHSLQLRINKLEVEALRGKKNQESAQDLPLLRFEARTGTYGGLEDSSLGPSITLPAIDNRYGISAEISQLLYAGGRITHSRKAAGHQKSAAEWSGKAAESDLRLQALSAFWDWSKAYYSVGAVNIAFDRIKAHNDDMASMRKAGTATDADTLSTDVLLARTRLRLEDAMRNVELARARITSITGRELPHDAIPLKPAPKTGLSIPSQSAAVSSALASRPEKSAAGNVARALNHQAEAASAGYLPQIALSARYEYARPNVLFFPPTEEWKSDVFVGAVLTWNIFDGGLTKARVTEARARAGQAELRLAQVEEQLTLEARQATIRLESAVARVSVARQAEKSAERSFEIASNLWKGGMKRHSEVLDALSSFADACLETVMAEADAALAAASLEHATGFGSRQTGEQQE